MERQLKLLIVGRTPINRQLACCDSVLVSVLLISDSESELLYVANFDSSRCRCHCNLTFCPTLECVIECVIVVAVVVIVVVVVNVVDVVECHINTINTRNSSIYVH